MSDGCAGTLCLMPLVRLRSGRIGLHGQRDGQLLRQSRGGGHIAHRHRQPGVQPLGLVSQGAHGSSGRRSSVHADAGVRPGKRVRPERRQQRRLVAGRAECRRLRRLAGHRRRRRPETEPRERPCAAEAWSLPAGRLAGQTTTTVKHCAQFASAQGQSLSAVPGCAAAADVRTAVTAAQAIQSATNSGSKSPRSHDGISWTAGAAARPRPVIGAAAAGVGGRSTWTSS